MDYLVKSVINDGEFRAYVVDATELVKKAIEIHNTNQVAGTILGRAMVATLLTASSVLKGEEQMQAVINGRSTIGNVVTEADANGGVRGYVTNPDAVAIEYDNKPSVGATVGINGFLKITKLAPYSKPFIGQVPIATGEIGDDFTYYLAQSEQIPSSVGVSVFVDETGRVTKAGGFLIQTLPGASEKNIEVVESVLQKLPPLYTQLAEGFTPTQILKSIFKDAKEVRIVDEMEVTLAPEPPKEYYAEALKTLPIEEIQQMIDEDHGAEIVTHFTNSKYYFSEDELRKIISEKK